MIPVYRQFFVGVLSFSSTEVIYCNGSFGKSSRYQADGTTFVITPTSRLFGRSLKKQLKIGKVCKYSIFSQTKEILSIIIVPQLSKCLKFEAIRGDQTDQRICI